MSIMPSKAEKEIIITSEVFIGPDIYPCLCLLYFAYSSSPTHQELSMFRESLYTKMQWIWMGTMNSGTILIIYNYYEDCKKEYWRSYQSYANEKDQLTLLSYDKWDLETETKFAYYRDLYIGNQKNFSESFIQTTPARAPQNFFRKGFFNFC